MTELLSTRTVPLGDDLEIVLHYGESQPMTLPDSVTINTPNGPIKGHVYFTGGRFNCGTIRASQKEDKNL